MRRTNAAMKPTEGRNRQCETASAEIDPSESGDGAHQPAAAEAGLDPACGGDRASTGEITEPENLTKGEASDLIDDIQCRPIARICANCKEEFQARPDKHRKYCDTCSRLTPAQRRKLMAETSSVVH